MSELTTIARPYAKAAFSIAQEQKAVTHWVEMLTFAAEVAQDGNIAPLLGGSVNAEEISRIFLSVCDKQLDEQGQNLIRVMAENGRLKVLPVVLHEFLLLKAEWDNQINATVVSAQALTDKQLANIESSLVARLGCKVTLTCSIDETLMAGAVIKAGDLVIDGSVRTKLNRLHDALQS